jgi:polyisoprenoid-binding protein YceI
MRGPAATTLRALLCLAPSLIAWTPANAPIVVLQPQSRLWVNGTSTVRAFECKATSFTADIDGAAPGAAAAVLAGEKAVQSVLVQVPAAKLECGNGTMNEHMLKALKAKDNPTIEFRLSTYRTSKAADGVQGELTGILKLGGVEKTITLTGTATDAGDGQFRVTGAHELRMSEFGLKAPTLMLGTMKVDDRVKVSFDLVLKG